MNSPIEMEKKFQVLQSDLEGFLRNKRFISSKTVVDEYLDTSDGLFYQDGIFIRVRNNITLDFKFNPDHLGIADVNDYVVCHEYNVPLPFQIETFHVFEALEKMIPIKCPHPYTYEKFLEENDLRTLLILNKNRTTDEDDTFVIAVDEFADFGVFLELEAKNNNMSQERFLKEIAKVTEGMAVKEFNSGYIELRLRQLNESLYLKGKYLINPELEIAA